MQTTDISRVNPFREGLREDRASQPCHLVIFGAAGGLTGRKLLPAIYNLTQANLVPPNFCVVGFARNPMDEAAFRETLKESVAHSDEVRVRDDGGGSALADPSYS